MLGLGLTAKIEEPRVLAVEGLASTYGTGGQQ